MRRAIARVVLFTACGVLSVRHARAGNPQEQQLAQALFDEGRALMDQRRFAEACPKLAESQRLDPGGGTLLNLALCHEGEGKVASAKTDYEEALRLATRDGRTDRVRIAREHLAAIEAAIPRMTVGVRGESASMPNLEVKLDGLVIPREAWGVAMAVDPGSHVVQATATDRTPWSSTVTIAKAEKKTVDVPPLPTLTVLPASAEPRTEQTPVPPPAHASETTTTPSSSTRMNPVFLGALGGTALAGGTSLISGVVSLVAYTSARSGCIPDRHYCKDDSSRSAADTAATTAWISTVSLGVAVVGGVITLVVPAQVTTTVRPTAGLSPSGGGFGIEGSF